MLSRLTAALLPLRCVARAGLTAGFVAVPAAIASTAAALTIPAATASATSPSSVPAMPASIAAESVAAISAVAPVAPVATWGAGASPIGYCAWIIAAGAVCLWLAGVVAAGLFAIRFAASFALTTVVSTVGGVGWR